MQLLKPLNIFYQEPDADRWIKYDRYPRAIIRRLIRGKRLPGGMQMSALNLLQGLDLLKIPYRFNDFNYIKKHPDELACIIGKPQLIFDRKWKNPIIFGPATFSHPSDAPSLFNDYPNIRKIIVPGPWIYNMFNEHYPKDKVLQWAIGNDTEKWSDTIKASPPQTDFLIYCKFLWNREQNAREVLNPIIDLLATHNLNYRLLKYGSYNPADLKNELANAKAAIYLCEHETQGLACQQILSTNTPVLAWDKGGFWEDPSYYPKVKYGPVSSVPYWDDRCGLKFQHPEQLNTVLQEFLNKLSANAFKPRSFILENFSLEISAQKYVDLTQQIIAELAKERD